MADVPNDQHDQPEKNDQIDAGMNAESAESTQQDSSLEQLIDGDTSANEAPNEGLVSGRAASVRFSRGTQPDAVTNQVRMDAANQSLADALRITYGFLQVGMVILLFLFIFSGFQKINEGERGIRVVFGKPSATELEPGLHPTPPYPIGELIRVEGGAVELPVAGQFMPDAPGANSPDAMLAMPISRFSGQSRLKPERDGSLITADLNIAHTQWRVNYHRDDHLKFVQNILPEQEYKIIMISIRQGVVRTMSETTIDDLLKKSAESIAARVRDVAQQTLDGFDSGITIDRVVLVRKTPPISLLDQFASVQSAAQNAGKAREDALLERDQWLNDIAGRAAPVLISMIDDYEKHIELGETEQANAMLEQIDTVLAGGEVNYKGQSTLALVSGEVSEILEQAKSESSKRVSQAIAELDQFKAKQLQYDANPMLMVARDWSHAMADFLNKDFVSTMYLPEGVDVELLINNDPDIDRERDRLRKREEALEAMRLRNEEFQNDLYKSRRGIVEQEEE